MKSRRICAAITSLFSAHASANIISFFNLVVLACTLYVLVGYASDTKRIANLTQENNIRPVIIRVGFREHWKNLKPVPRNITYIQDKDSSRFYFKSSKNIALNISGYIVIDHYRYGFVFFDDQIGKVENKNIPGFSTWQMMAPDYFLYAYFVEDGRQKSNEDNKICLLYSDIEGNHYTTVENDGGTKSFRITDRL